MQLAPDPHVTRPSFRVGLQLLLAGGCHWLEHKVPRWALILAVLLFGGLGSRSVVLLHDVQPYFIPSVKAVLAGSPDWPLAVLAWSMVLLFTAACLLHKRVAFAAALQLHRRFGTRLCP